MEDPRIVRLHQIFESAKPAKPKSTRKTTSSQAIEGNENIQADGGKVGRQSIKGNGNVQIGGGVENMTIRTAKGPKIEVSPAPDSIGADGLLKERVIEAFGKLGTEREKRFGKKAYEVMYSTFKKDFNIPKGLPWTTIWNWNSSRAPEILEYLELKYKNTISGRLESAAKKPGYQHTRGQLFAREKELLEHLGFNPSSPEVKKEMLRLFGTDTHKNLDLRQHTNWVTHIERLVDKMYGQED